MKKINKILLISGICSFVFVAFTASAVVTMAELDTCKTYVVSGGNQYRHYFHINDVQTGAQGHWIFNLKFYVLAASNAHIILSKTDTPSAFDPVYEIVIGGGDNSFTEIRRRRKKQPIVTAYTMDVLSAIEHTSVVVNMSDLGTIGLYINDKPVIERTLLKEDIIEVNYVSFTSWSKTAAKWYYDCGHNEELDEVLPTLTDLERLRRDILLNYDPTMPPEDIREVNLMYMQNEVLLDLKKDLLKHVGRFYMEWYDPRLQWNPADYGGISDMKIYSLIWVPEFHILNAKGRSHSQLNLSLFTSVNHTGGVNGFTGLEVFHTLCAENFNIKSWPNDIVNCKVGFSFALIGSSLTVNYLPSEEVSTSVGEWKLTKFDYMSIELRIEYSSPDANETGIMENSLMLVLRYQFTRNSKFYHLVFYTPFIVSCIFVLESFWTEGFIRLVLSLLGTFILCCFYLLFGNHAPLSYVPAIMKLYQIAILCTVFRIFTFILIKTLDNYQPEKPPPRIVQKLIGSPYVAALFTVDNKESTKLENPWKDIALFVDGILFYLYLLLFVASFAVLAH